MGVLPGTLGTYSCDCESVSQATLQREWKEDCIKILSNTDDLLEKTIEPCGDYGVEWPLPALASSSGISVGQ